MEKNRIFCSLLSLFLCFALFAAAASCMAETVNEPVIPMDGTLEYPVPLGEGASSFLFSVTDSDGRESWFEIRTDAVTVGNALLDLGLIDGEEGPYGLYVKTVCGILADYDTDGRYWAFYIDGEYAMSGIDATDVVPGRICSLKVE